MSRISVPARQAATEALVAKGLAEVDSQRADIEVNMKGQFLPKVETTDWGYMALPSSRVALGSHQGGNRYQGLSESEYEERILTIEIFDNRTKQPIWVGWSKRDVTGQPSDVDIEKLKAAIANILSEFPAGSAKSKL
jgi:hypothetical protein